MSNFKRLGPIAAFIVFWNSFYMVITTFPPLTATCYLHILHPAYVCKLCACVVKENQTLFLTQIIVNLLYKIATDHLILKRYHCIMCPHLAPAFLCVVIVAAPGPVQAGAQTRHQIPDGPRDLRRKLISVQNV